jgi:hypothetical protein
MGRYLPSDEVRDEILAAFPKNVGEFFYKLWINVGHLHLNWKNYRSLYGTSPGRIRLLNWAASSFFGLLDGIVRHDVVLAIARLTDRPWTGSYENASFARLIEMLEPHMDTPSLQLKLKDFKAKQEDLEAYCERVLQIRNRLLAHDDLETALGYHADPLPGISRAYIENVLAKIRSVLGDVEECFRGSRTSHEYIHAIDDGESLILALESAREHEKCRRRELNQNYGSTPTDE